MASCQGLNLASAGFRSGTGPMQPRFPLPFWFTVPAVGTTNGTASWGVGKLYIAERCLGACWWHHVPCGGIASGSSTGLDHRRQAGKCFGKLSFQLIMHGLYARHELVVVQCAGCWAVCDHCSGS